MKEEKGFLNKIVDLLAYRLMKFEGEVYKQNFKTELCREFISYWSEMNKSKTKMKFELEKTFDVKRRMLRWKKNQESKKLL